jgi:type I restriction enzyme S subunit
LKESKAMTDTVGNTLGDYIYVKHGFAFKGEYFTDEPTLDVLVTPGNFAIGGGFQDEKLKYYAGPVPEDYVLTEGELVVTMTDLSKAGDTLGYPALIPASSGRRYLHNQRIGLVGIRDEGETDKRFLFYRLRASDYRHHILATASGSTVRHTSPGRICEFATTLPPIDEQRAIAGVLGALDDKIEQNRRTAWALERLARAIFRAWFVDFEPVKAKAAGATAFPSMPQPVFDALPTRFVDSDIGPVPEGWEVGKLRALLSERKERVTPSSETEALPYVPIDCIGTKQITLETRKPGSDAKSSLIKFLPGDILFGAMRPYFHKVCLAPFEGTTRTTCFVLAPTSVSDRQFALMTASADDTVAFATAHSVGSTIPYAKWEGSLAEMSCLLATAESRRAFGLVADPMVELAGHFIREAEPLAEMRDYLLPKLLSGAVRVSVDADGSWQS